jgi:hypothetical protein
MKYNQTTLGVLTTHHEPRRLAVASSLFAPTTLRRAFKGWALYRPIRSLAGARST